MDKQYAVHTLEQLVIKSGQHRHHEALQTLKAAVLAQQTTNKQSVKCSQCGVDVVSVRCEHFTHLSNVGCNLHNTIN